jgi:hypothetical protein
MHRSVTNCDLSCDCQHYPDRHYLSRTHPDCSSTLSIVNVLCAPTACSTNLDHLQSSLSAQPAILVNSALLLCYKHSSTAIFPHPTQTVQPQPVLTGNHSFNQAHRTLLLCLHAPSWHPGGQFLTLAAWWWCCLQVILLGLMGLLDSQLWSGRLLSYCEVALLGFRCRGWRWGTSASYIVFCVPIFLCSQCLRRKSCYLPGSGHCLTGHYCCTGTSRLVDVLVTHMQMSCLCRTILQRHHTMSTAADCPHLKQMPAPPSLNSVALPDAHLLESTSVFLCVCVVILGGMDQYSGLSAPSNPGHFPAECLCTAGPPSPEQRIW